MRLWMPRYSTGSNCGLSWATGLWIRCLTSNFPRGSARLLPAPRQLGAHLEEMNPDSPVARCYAAYLRMHGVPTERKKLKRQDLVPAFFVIALQVFLVFPTFESAFAAPSNLSPKAEVKVDFRMLNIKIQLFL